MSNQFTEHRIKSHYVAEMQNGHLNFIPRFAVFVQKRELYVSQLWVFFYKLGYN